MQAFHVFNYLYTPVILGFDFLQNHNAKIDLASQTLTLKDGFIAVCLSQTLTDSQGLGRAKCNLIIPPRSHSNAPLRLSNVKNGDQVMLEPIL